MRYVPSTSEKQTPDPFLPVVPFDASTSNGKLLDRKKKHVENIPGVNTSRSPKRPLVLF